jgi:hypothetical protein
MNTDNWLTVVLIICSSITAIIGPVLGALVQRWDSHPRNYKKQGIDLRDGAILVMRLAGLVIAIYYLASRIWYNPPVTQWSVFTTVYLTMIVVYSAKQLLTKEEE